MKLIYLIVIMLNYTGLTIETLDGMVPGNYSLLIKYRKTKIGKIKGHIFEILTYKGRDYLFCVDLHLAQIANDIKALKLKLK